MVEIKRYPANPIMGGNPDLSWGRDQARNPGVIHDGSMFHMVFTATARLGKPDETMLLGYAKSLDGVNFECAPEPFMAPPADADAFDHGTLEDARVTQLDGRYYIAYAGRSLANHRYAAGERRLGPNQNNNPTWSDNYRRCGLAVTDDWRNVQRLTPLTSEHLCDANVVLFPERINGKYVFMHRPTPFIPWLLPSLYAPPCVWLVFADDLTSPWSSNAREMPWNMKDGVDIPDDHLLIRPEYEWERMKVGASGVPMPTDDGWLTLYHAVDRQGVYRVGVMLLDREDPRRVIARSPVPIMEPETPLEHKGLYPHCIFPCANVVIGDNIYIYYGAADSYVCLATVSLSRLLDYVLTCRINPVAQVSQSLDELSMR